MHRDFVTFLERGADYSNLFVIDEHLGLIWRCLYEVDGQHLAGK
jgi:hypothetical protein